MGDYEETQYECNVVNDPIEDHVRNCCELKKLDKILKYNIEQGKLFPSKYKFNINPVSKCHELEENLIQILPPISKKGNRTPI